MDSSNSEEATASSENRAQYCNTLNSLFIPQQPQQPNAKKKRSQPGNPDPDAEVISLSPKSLTATNRFVCEICNKGFQRDQNLQLHRRGHNLPWKLRQRSSKDAVIKKRVYVCPEASCVHHHPSRALGDLTGIKKHYYRKHGEKKWKCDKCSRRYAVHSDWKAHVKTCGTREYRCDCGILFARKDSFITHRAFCDALAEESAKLIAGTTTTNPSFASMWDPLNPSISADPNPNPNPNLHLNPFPFPSHVKPELPFFTAPYLTPSPHLSASTSLLYEAPNFLLPTAEGCYAEQLVGPTCSSGLLLRGDRLTRDFLGVAAGEEEELMDLLSVSNNGGGHTKPPNNYGFGLPNEDECPCFL